MERRCQECSARVEGFPFPECQGVCRDERIRAEGRRQAAAMARAKADEYDPSGSGHWNGDSAGALRDLADAIEAIPVGKDGAE